MVFGKTLWFVYFVDLAAISSPSYFRLEAVTLIVLWSWIAIGVDVFLALFLFHDDEL